MANPLVVDTTTTSCTFLTSSTTVPRGSRIVILATACDWRLVAAFAGIPELKSNLTNAGNCAHRMHSAEFHAHLLP